MGEICRMPISNTHLSYEKIDVIFNKSKKIFFIGIGGVSMSALSAYCRFFGKEIYGYDCARTSECAKLEKHAVIKYCSTPDSVKGMDLVIYTNAISEENFEYASSKKLKIPTLSRANFLGYLGWRHKRSIAVSGTHGKSTTTAYLARIFDYAEKNPTVFCGASMRDYLDSAIFGGKELFICEACEYMDSFLELKPSVGCILNIEYDHPDYFSNEKRLIDSFARFSQSCERIVANIDCPNVKKLIECQNHPRVTTFSLKTTDADYFGELRGSSFACFYRGKELFEVSLRSRGTHFVYDAMCASAVALSEGVSSVTVATALSDASGVSRRLEFVRKTDTGAHIFEDYAHHPTEIRATLDALWETGYRKICCVFQPHTFSRTRYVFEGKYDIFDGCESVYILPTYAARESFDASADSRELAKKCGAVYAPSLPELCCSLKASQYDCIVFMGAGDIGCFKKYF